MDIRLRYNFSKKIYECSMNSTYMRTQNIDHINDMLIEYCGQYNFNELYPILEYYTVNILMNSINSRFEISSYAYSSELVHASFFTQDKNLNECIKEHKKTFDDIMTEMMLINV